MEDLLRTEIKRSQRRLFLTLPIPPSVNSIYYNTKGGGRRLTSKAEKYIRDVRAFCRASAEDNDWKFAEKGDWLYMDMVFYFPDKRTRDSHNCLKVLIDAIEGVLFQNDMYVLPRINSVEFDKENPRVEILFYDQTKAERTKQLKQIWSK